ncbi:MAG: ABC transporter permease [Actinobacteria bacterium]|nr:ABC transporter permease [Actinomycetota bacterium]
MNEGSLTEVQRSDEAETPSSDRPTGGWSLLSLALRAVQIGPVLSLIALAAVMSVLSPHFLTTLNLQNLGSQSATLAVVAIGSFLVMVVRGIDISVGAVSAMAVVVPMTLLSGNSGFVLLVAMIACGGAIGILNGLLVVKGRLAQPLIVTLATLGVARGIAFLTSENDIVGVPPVIQTLGRGMVGPIPAAVVLVVALLALMWVVTKRTRFGVWLYAIGANPEAARRLGIRVDGVIVTCYLLCAALAALAGVIASGRTGVASPNQGMGLELLAITAVVAGGASFGGGHGTVLNVVVGALMIGVIDNGLDLLNVNSYYQTVAVGVLILAALELEVLRGHIETQLRARRAREAEQL